MKRFAKPALAAGALALAVTLSAPQQAQAGHRGGHAAAAAIFGLAAGAIIAGAVSQPRHSGYNTYYYPPYYPPGPVYYGGGGYYPYVAAPAPRYYRAPHRHHRHHRYYRSRGVQFQLHFNPSYPNY